MFVFSGNRRFLPSRKLRHLRLVCLHLLVRLWLQLPRQCKKAWFQRAPTLICRLVIPRKEKNTADGDSTRQVVNPSTSHPSLALEDVDLSDLDETTLSADFQVGRHVSLFPYFPITLSGARSALPMGVASESMFDCSQSSLDSISVFISDPCYFFYAAFHSYPSSSD